MGVPAMYDDLIQRALSEDIGRGDITSNFLIPGTLQGEGLFTAGEDFILAGVSVCSRCFTLLDPGLQVIWDNGDGDEIKKSAVFGRVLGRARSMLTAERVSLNFLQHLSGIATRTRAYVKLVEGTTIQITDTRKTLPGLRELEKYAVETGGGKNHRGGLDDGVLIKDNHISLSGSIEEAICRARAGSHHLLKIEVETDSLEKVEEALHAGADVIMLDNMSLEDIKKALQVIGNKVPVEVSGRMDQEKISRLTGLDIQYISIGALTHSAPAIDISFEVQSV